MITRWLRRVRVFRDERGAIAILMAVPVLLFVVFGVMSVDFGTWFAARRDVQSRADAIALAGAIELPSFNDPAGSSANALLAVHDWASANGLTPDRYQVEVINTCFSAADAVPTGVHVTVHRPTATLFDLGRRGTMDIIAEATACTGTPSDGAGIMPWAVSSSSNCFTAAALLSNRTPIFGQRCALVVGGGAAAVGAVGQLSLDPGAACPDGGTGASQYQTNIEGRVNVLCRVGESVSDFPGVAVNATRNGVRGRLSTEGPCDTLAIERAAEVLAMTNAFNLHPTLVPLAAPVAGIADFFEVFRAGHGYDPARPAERLQTIDCNPTTPTLDTSPRNVTVAIVDRVGTFDGAGCAGSHCYVIRGFARMYIEGCLGAGGVLDRRCLGVGGGGSFTVYGRIVDAFGMHSGAVGLNRFGSYQTFLSR